MPKASGDRSSGTLANNMRFLFWLPIAAFVAFYLCSWPSVQRRFLHYTFDGVAIMLSIGLPFVWIIATHPSDSKDPAITETFQWMPVLFPLWTTLFGMLFLIAFAILRYFLFRPLPANVYK